MKIETCKEVEVLNHWINFGYSFKRIGLGFSLDKYALSIDFIIFWFGVEFK